MNSRIKALRDYHDGLEPGQRHRLYAALALAIGVSLAVGYWSSLTTWQPLLTGRSYEEVLDAAAALDNAGVDYELDDGRLMVPIDHVGRARGALAGAEKLPGLEDVGALRIGLTPAAQDWAFVRSREGDLARMVNGIDGVASSQVRIVPERESLFVGDGAPARASVFVRLRPGQSLALQQVRAIVNLVAHSVEGLTAEAVSVVDDGGRVLHEGEISASGEGAQSGRRMLELKRQLEVDHERSVERALLPILGDEAAMSVTATVDLDLATTEVVQHQVHNEQPAVVEEALNELTMADGASEAGGVPGADANLPERGGLKGNSRTTQKSETATSYTYPRATEHKTVPAGSVQRVSVAVQVDATRLAALAEASGVEIEALEQRVQDAVRAAVGFDERRKDLVSVQVVPFAERAWVEGTAAASAAPIDVSTIERLAPWAMMLLTLVLVFAFVIRPLMARLDRVEKAEAEEEDPAVEADPDDDLAERLTTMIANFQPVDASDLNRLAQRESTAAAQVLRDWKDAAGGGA